MYRLYSSQEAWANFTDPVMQDYHMPLWRDLPAKKEKAKEKKDKEHKEEKGTFKMSFTTV